MERRRQTRNLGVKKRRRGKGRDGRRDEKGRVKMERGGRKGGEGEVSE